MLPLYRLTDLPEEFTQHREIMMRHLRPPNNMNNGRPLALFEPCLCTSNCMDGVHVDASQVLNQRILAPILYPRLLWTANFGTMRVWAPMSSFESGIDTLLLLDVVNASTGAHMSSMVCRNPEHVVGWWQSIPKGNKACTWSSTLCVQHGSSWLDTRPIVVCLCGSPQASILLFDWGTQCSCIHHCQNHCTSCQCRHTSSSGTGPCWQWVDVGERCCSNTGWGLYAEFAGFDDVKCGNWPAEYVKPRHDARVVAKTSSWGPQAVCQKCQTQIQGKPPCFGQGEDKEKWEFKEREVRRRGIIQGEGKVERGKGGK